LKPSTRVTFILYKADESLKKNIKCFITKFFLGAKSFKHSSLRNKHGKLLIRQTQQLYPLQFNSKALDDLMVLLKKKGNA
jgi:hypothetical protein